MSACLLWDYSDPHGAVATSGNATLFVVRVHRAYYSYCVTSSDFGSHFGHGFGTMEDAIEAAEIRYDGVRIKV